MSIPQPIYQGKIRALYPASPEDTLVMLVSDRVSAFDVVFPQDVADKGKMLNQISCSWCKAIEESGLSKKYNFINHLITDDYKKFPEPYCFYPEFAERSIYIKKTERIGFECIVRGYLAGSAWKEYQKNGTVCGETLPPGLKAGEKLPTPIFTPSTKEEAGKHDVNVHYDAMEKKLGKELSSRLRDISLAVYNFSVEKTEQCGILTADTKFEFGLYKGQITLIDEVLTPDSSRYWRASDYNPGTIPAGFDKQHIRDYVEMLKWNKKPPAPNLPKEITAKTAKLYKEIQEQFMRVL